MNMINKTEKLLEPGRELPVAGTWDVVVAGGGIAGVAAAVAAARSGASVCLIEKSYGLGGLATLGHVTVWLPICDGCGRQVMAGLPEELLRLSVAGLQQERRAAGLAGIPDCWQAGGDPVGRRGARYRAAFSPASYLLALEQLVLAAGVHLLYDTRVCAVHRRGKTIQHLMVENKDGRSAVAGGCMIDATGDADLCYLAGEATEFLDNNVPAGWFYALDSQGLTLHKWSRRYHRTGEKDPAHGPSFRGDCAGDITAHILATRAGIRERLAELRAADPQEDIQPMALPSTACLRMTRRLVGTFSTGSRHQHQWFEDTIGLTGDWRKAGPVHAIPWRALHGIRNSNLLAAGRCISVDRTLWDVTRAIPACALTGAAAGTAAGLAARGHRGSVHRLPVATLQAELAQQGFLLDPALAAPAADGAPENPPAAGTAGRNAAPLKTHSSGKG